MTNCPATSIRAGTVVDKDGAPVPFPCGSLFGCGGPFCRAVTLREGIDNPPAVQIDPEGQIITIFGIRYAMDLFKHMGVGPLNQPFELVNRADGVVTVRMLPKGGAAS